MNIVFFGTPTFAAYVLEAILLQGYRVVAVVTRPDRPKGRSQKMQPSEVKELIQSRYPDIPILQPEKASTDEFVETLKSFSPDVFVVAAYGEIIKTNLLHLPKKKCINVHPSLLPKYRGATPIQSALLNGDEETGVTIMEMVLAMDAGDILEVVKMPISGEITFGELEKKLWEISGPALCRVLETLKNGPVKGRGQDPDRVTFAKKITPEDRIIDWSQPCEKIHNQIRALSPRPGAYTFVEIDGEKKRLGIKRSKQQKDLEGSPGQTISLEKDHWIVGCGCGALLLEEVQLEGKKTLPIKEFLLGKVPVICK